MILKKVYIHHLWQRHNGFPLGYKFFFKDLKEKYLDYVLEVLGRLPQMT